jgi:hypothetical protein
LGGVIAAFYESEIKLLDRHLLRCRLAVRRDDEINGFVAERHSGARSSIA